LLRIAGLVVGAQVLDAGLVQHVGADLAAPADVRLAVLQLLLLLAPLLHLHLVHLGLQHLHGGGAGLLLGALALAGHPPAWGGVGLGVVGWAGGVLFGWGPRAPGGGWLSPGGSAGLISISISSPPPGETNPAVKEVWRRALESKGDLRTRRCTPVSVRSQP